MDKVAYFKEQIVEYASMQKEAGIKDAFKNFKNNIDDVVESTKWGRDRANYKRFMNGGGPKSSFGGGNKSNFGGSANFGGGTSSNFGGSAKSSFNAAHPLAGKYSLDGVTTKKDFVTAKRKAMMANHPDKFHAEFGSDAEKMKAQNDKFKAIMNDFDNMEKSPWYEKLAFYLNRRMEK